MNTRWMAAITIALMLGMCSACSPAQPTATPVPEPTATAAPKEPLARTGDVLGVWKATGGGTLLMEFKADGSYEGKDTAGKLYDSGRFRLDDAKLVLESDSSSICAGQVGTHEAYVIREGDRPVKLQLVLVDEPCQFRVQALTNRTLAIVGP